MVKVFYVKDFYMYEKKGDTLYVVSKRDKLPIAEINLKESKLYINTDNKNRFKKAVSELKKKYNTFETTEYCTF